MRRRVVVTGIGLVTPLSALGARETWRALLACRTGVRSLTEEDMPPVSWRALSFFRFCFVFVLDRALCSLNLDLNLLFLFLFKPKKKKKKNRSTATPSASSPAASPRP